MEEYFCQKNVGFNGTFTTIELIIEFYGFLMACGYKNLTKTTFLSGLRQENDKIKNLCYTTLVWHLMCIIGIVR